MTVGMSGRKTPFIGRSMPRKLRKGGKATNLAKNCIRRNCFGSDFVRRIAAWLGMPILG